jgi:hypothetical protein
LRREALYNSFIEFRVNMKVVWLIKICLNETYSKVHIGKHLSDIFPIRNRLKQGGALSPLFFNFALEYAIRKAQEIQHDEELHDLYSLPSIISFINSRRARARHIARRVRIAMCRGFGRKVREKETTRKTKI